MDLKKEIAHIAYNFKEISKSKYFYISLFVLGFGIFFNNLSSVYLYKLVLKGNSFPILSDLILENIPYYDISYIYDWFSVFSAIFFIIYIIHKEEYRKIPYSILVIGLFFILRGFFIILTPFGNPENFIETKGIFHGFTKYEIGVFPSGHTGAVFLEFLLVKGIYRLIISFNVIVVIFALFLSRSHYSIDILAGILFSYALYSFSEKYIKHRFIIQSKKEN